MLTPPSEAYFSSHELETYFLGSPSVRFVQQVLPPLQEEFDELLRSTGVAAEPRRIEFEPDLTWEERTRLREGQRSSREEPLKDYELDGLTEFLRRLGKSDFASGKLCSEILWRFLLSHANEYEWFRGVYSWFYYSPYSKHFPAKFLMSLREEPWLPGRDGKLHKAAELTLSDLPDEFERSPQLAEHLSMKADALSEMAARLNVDEEALTLLCEHPEEWKQFVKQLKRAKESALDASAGSRNDKPIGDVDSGSSLADRVSSDAGQLGGERINEADSGDEQAAADSGQARESSKRLPVIVAAGDAESGLLYSGAGPNNEVAHTGVGRALQYERQQGRQPEEMPHTNEGFDIRSWDPLNKVMRFIEVKSLSGNWDEANVALSAPQFRFGTRLEPNQEFWLYVVERAGRVDERVHCIPDPSRKATHFIYPRGWEKLEADESKKAE